MSMEEAKSLKEEGNKHFKAGNISDALSCYTKAINLRASDNADTATYLKNRAACFLKQEKYKESVKDCTEALELVQNDPKSLFRRCQAYDALGQSEEAYKDAMTLLRIDPKNKAIQPILRKLNPIIQNKMDAQMSTDNRVEQMFDLTFTNAAADDEKRQQAANNLIVLAREDAGAERIIHSGGIQKLIRLLETEKERTLQLTAIRVLACLAQSSNNRAKAVMEGITLNKICAYLGADSDDLSTAMAHVLQSIINSISGLERLKADREKHEAERKADVNNKARPYLFLSEKIDVDEFTYLEQVLKVLVPMINFVKVSAPGRDNVMELLIKFVSKKDGVGWHNTIMKEGGINNILEAAGTIPENKLLPITTNTRMHASLLLSQIYESLHSEAERNDFSDRVDTFFNDLLTDTIMDSKVEAVLALAALLQGPSEVGNAILGRQGILQLILALADSGNAIHTKYAVEALVHSASKKDRCSGVIKQATPILKELYQSQSDAIKVRALVGLCKLGSYGGQDASNKSYAEGSTQALSKACRKFLSNTAKDVDLRKWAAEGLAYLSLDAEVKEELVQDATAIRSLLDLAKTSDKGAVYPVAQILVNVTNSFDKAEPEPEMLELAKFAKHHIPEPHEKDGDDYVAARVKKIVSAGAVNALVSLATTDSDSSKELLARVFLAITTDKDYRGLVVQQGGAKALLPLALHGTDKGKLRAAQALAKIAITTNPEIAFPGERACEVVRPLVNMLHSDRKAIENYEALLAMTNLASLSDRVRKRIVKEKGLDWIEHYMFEDHDDLRRGATECMCNMVMSEEAVERFKGANDRLKLLVLFCGEDDAGLVRAAAGALAMITADADQDLCGKIISSTTKWTEILAILAANSLPDIQHRGNYICRNMIASSKDIASKVVETNILEVLMAVSKLDDPARAGAKACAAGALEAAQEHGLIQPS